MIRQNKGVLIAGVQDKNALLHVSVYIADRNPAPGMHFHADSGGPHRSRNCMKTRQNDQRERTERMRKHYTREDIIQRVEDEDVEFIRLQFTDIFGNLKNVAITVSQLEKALDNECMFDGSSIEGFARIEESDMYLNPDYNTF